MRLISGLLLLAVIAGGCAQQGEPASDIVFQSTRDGNFEIYIMDGTGGNQRRLTSSPLNDIMPSISPDRSSIVFASDRTGNWEIVRTDPDGSNQVVLTHGEGTNTAPSWTSDGRILFVSTRDALHGDVYVMNRDGGGLERVTSDSLVKDSPILSADGHTIYMTVSVQGRSVIATTDRNTKAVRLLGPLTSDSKNPALSADGKRLLFVSNRQDGFQVYLLDAATGNVSRVTTREQGYATPAWTERENEILFSRGGCIYRFSLANGSEHMLSAKGDSAPATE